MLRALRLERALELPVRWMTRLAIELADRFAALSRGAAARVVAGAILTLTLVHAVETVKFVAGWSRYEAAIRALASGTTSDPALGDARFVSSDRIDAATNRLAWQTTTQFLSVLVAPGLAPARLVIDPSAGYFWPNCALATASEKADSPIPVESRRLIRVHVCLHR